MRTRRFNALNDILFKFVFGHRENKDITLSFINAVLGLEGERAFVDLQFADREKDMSPPTKELMKLTLEKNSARRTSRHALDGRQHLHSHRPCGEHQGR